MKLIKLQDKFILVSDGKPTQWYLDDTNAIRRVVTDDEDYWLNRADYKAIIAGIPELPSIDFSLLSEEECKKIGWIDVEELALEKYPIDICKESGYPIHYIGDDFNKTDRDNFIKGFKTTQSLNDKRFSEKQVRILVDSVTEFMSHHEPSEFNEWFEKKIQSLQQTSWDVEVNNLNQVTKIL